MAAPGGARPDPIEASGLASGPAAGRPATGGGGGGTAYLRITRGRFDPARYEEVARLTQDIAAAAQPLPGYRNGYNGPDRATGALAAAGLWDSAEHARFARGALGDAHTRAMARGLQLEPPEVYELTSET
jgi:hypothetical protein